MSTAIPQIPPRPQRTSQDQSSGASMAIPRIPPRPTRKIDRSVSPHRESFARSPLNEYPPKSPMYQGGSTGFFSAPDPPPRPSSVVLPTIGQEGSEYADVITIDPPEATRVVNDLELHAPKPSLPISSAKKRLSTVTRTDSDKAASFGLGKPRSSEGTSGGDDKDPSSRSLKKKSSFTSQTSFNTERRPSSVESDHGIPEIGQRVPMYPNAGDVQAPSPAPFPTPYAPGIGFHNDGSKPRHHGRKLSARGEIPPDAYGRYGHGVPHQNDHFEKAYYEKHPELFKKELGQYGEGRTEWALSSDDLNKIVRNTASRGAGVGTSPAAFGTPSEEIGFQATEEYTSRISSPRPQSSLQAAQTNTSVTHTDSPLRKESFPADGGAKTEIESALRNGLRRPSDITQDSEVEDEDTIHVDDPGSRLNKVYSGTSRFESTEDLRNQSGDDLQEEHGYSAPILAADEVAKEPWGYELQPAVSPLHERKFGHHDDSYHTRSGSDSMSNSRPSSRPGSIHGIIPGLRVQDSTPLEDLAEYEPLFPEEEKASGQQKPSSPVDQLRNRSDLKSRKFPSQDIWEDTPNSLQYTATVSTPQLVDETDEAIAKATRTETPEQAFARRQEELAEKESLNSESFLRREQNKKPWALSSETRTENRSNVKQRFPSRDIWEDSPDCLQLQTTVGAPQSEEVLSPPDERPTTGAVVFHHEMAAAGVPLSSEEGRATTGIAATLKPQVPTRPVRSKLSESPEKVQPVIPERPDRSKVLPADSTVPPLPLKTKPQVPARPSKPIARDSSEAVPLTKVTSNTSTKSVGSDHGVAAASKPKPPVPSRPVGGKIAALQGGFMSDLNKRLQLGPQAPKKDEPVAPEPEEVKEKAPLVDARKGRARGPARRAPAKSPTPIAESTPEKPSVVLGFSVPLTVWEIDPEENTLQFGSSSVEEIAQPAADKSPTLEIPTLATKIAGEPVHEVPEAAQSVTGLSSSPSAPKEEAKAELPEEVEKSVLAVESTSDEANLVKPIDEDPKIADDVNEIESEPVVAKGAIEPQPDLVQEDDLTASTGTIKPPKQSEPKLD